MYVVNVNYCVQGSEGYEASVIVLYCVLFYVSDKEAKIRSFDCVLFNINLVLFKFCNIVHNMGVKG